MAAPPPTSAIQTCQISCDFPSLQHQTIEFDRYIWFDDHSARDSSAQHQLWETPDFKINIDGGRTKFQDG